MIQKNSYFIYLLCAVVTVSQSALADNALTRQNTVAVPTSSTMPANVNATMNGSSGIQQNGDTAAKNQDAGMIAALASAAFSAAMAAATCPDPTQQAACIASTIGALAGLAVAGMMNNAKNKSNAQVATSSISNPTSTTPQSIESNRTYAETKKKLAQVSKMAGNQIDVDKGTAKLKDGRELKLSDMKSQASMAAAGLKPSEIKAFGDLMKESAKKVNAAKGADGNPAPAEMGGGGTITQTASSDSPSGGDTAKRVPASVPGATRDFNGTPIGVSVESIWVMMNRRYAHEAETKKFSN